MTDAELVSRMRDGDGAALAELDRRHRGVATGIAFRALRNHGLAEDAVQEAFFDLWRGASKFDPARASVSTWVCVLAHRRAVDIARREARRAHESEHELDSVADDSYTTEELVVLGEERRELELALARLSERQRRVLELSYFGGMTQREIAKALAVPLGTVKSRAHDGLRALRAMVSPSPHTELS